MCMWTLLGAPQRVSDLPNPSKPTLLTGAQQTNQVAQAVKRPRGRARTSEVEAATETPAATPTGHLPSVSSHISIALHPLTTYALQPASPTRQSLKIQPLSANWASRFAERDPTGTLRLPRSHISIAVHVLTKGLVLVMQSMPFVRRFKTRARRPRLACVRSPSRECLPSVPRPDQTLNARLLRRLSLLRSGMLPVIQ